MELIVALIKSKSIELPNGENHRNKIVSIFERIFSMDLKDAESKLSRATNRQDLTPFLNQLKESFEYYCIEKEQKRENR